MFRLCSHAANSPIPHLLPEEADQHSIDSRRVGHHGEAIEEDHRLRSMTVQGTEVTVLHHLLDVGRLHDDMEDDQVQETVIWIPTGHAHFHGQGHPEEHDRDRFRQDPEAGLHHEGTGVGYVGRARHRQEEEGEGVRVTPAILATAIEVAAEAEVDMEGAGDDRVMAMLRVRYKRTTVRGAIEI